MALGAVLSEIDEIAKATFRSITLATMLRLIERQQAAATTATARQSPNPVHRLLQYSVRATAGPHGRRKPA